MIIIPFSVVDFRITSLVEDLRPGFVGNSVVRFAWNQLYNRTLHTILYVWCSYILRFLILYTANIESLKITVQSLRLSEFDANACGIDRTFTEEISTVSNAVHYYGALI